MKKFKLNKNIKKIWLQKLRDGSYIKQKGCLGHGKYRCALGILVAEGFSKAVFGAYLPKSFMPSEIQKEIGLMSDKGKSFKKIADWIEINL